MDEIINNIIEIDKQAKSIFYEANNRNDNFDELVEDAIEKQKRIIDKEIEEKIQIKKMQCNMNLEKEKNKIEEEKNKKINELNAKYLELKQQKINEIMEELRGAVN